MSAVRSSTSEREWPLKFALVGVLAGLIALALGVALSLSSGSATLAALATAVLLALVFAAHRLHLMVNELACEGCAAEASATDCESESRDALAMRATGDGVWDWNPATGELFLSSQVLSALGESGDPLRTTGDTWLERVHPDDRAPYRAALVEHLEGRTPRFECEYRVLDKHARYRWLLARGLAQRNGRGVACRVLGSLADIGARKESEVALHARIGEVTRREMECTTQLETALQELEAFSHTVSHSLRAPLRAIDGCSAALLADHGARLDSDAWLQLERIRAGVRRMGDLMDDLLELSRVTRYPLTRAPVDLSALAASVAHALQAADPTRQVAFDIAPGLHADADPRLLRIALEHLLDNAWKFTTGIEPAQVRVGQTTDDGGTPGFYVEDNGTGFDMGRADELFLPFQRLHADGKFESNGIGLATVARVVRRHGGRVWASSRPREATRFSFTLPGVLQRGTNDRAPRPIATVPAVTEEACQRTSPPPPTRPADVERRTSKR